VKDKTGGQKILIMDACVLIDFLNSDRKVFRLISDHLGTLYVASPVLDEIKEIENEQELVEIGLKVVEPETGDAMAAGGITTDDVLLIGREIHRSNPKHISAEILAKFEKIIEDQTGG